MKIGMLSTGIYLPEKVVSAEEIATASDIPVEVIRDKMGISEKRLPSDVDHTVEMGVRAAKKALEKAKMDAKEIDLIIYIGEEYKEYPLWTAAIKMQEDLGAHHAWGFDVALRCGTTIMALQVAQAMMLQHADISTVLLAGGYRNGDLIDYKNERTRFMFNLGAGGGAIILQKGYEKNSLLASEMITDGSFSEDVLIPYGGTKHPLTTEQIEKNQFKLDVMDPAGMKERLEQKSMQNFLKVIRTSLDKSGYREEDIDYLAILHMKRSAHDYVLEQLGLNEEQSIYLQEYGHIGQIDQILSLELAEKQGKLKNGDVVVLVSAGIGYAWGAMTIKWGVDEE